MMMQTRKKPKSLDAPVVVKLRDFEAWAYYRVDEWKRKYRYTLVQEFRVHITSAKNAVISSFELPNSHRNEKLYLYSVAVGELAIVESNMDIMVRNEFCIMSEKDWSKAAQMLDGIRADLSRLINSLTNKPSGSEFPNCGAERVSAG